jgi:uncharacterized Zn finger protein (UPF0148 family)
MDAEKSKSLSLVERMRQKALAQKSYGGESVESAAKMGAATCPHCGAGRAKGDGLTQCAYCGHEFMATMLSDGLNIKKEDNSK